MIHIKSLKPLFREILILGPRPHFCIMVSSGQGIFGSRAELETMTCLVRTATELCKQNVQTQAVCQTRSMTLSKGHFHLLGFRAEMLLRLTMTPSHSEKACHMSADKCPQRVHPCQLWPSDGSSTWEFERILNLWNGEVVFCLPGKAYCFPLPEFLDSGRACLLILKRIPVPSALSLPFRV